MIGNEIREAFTKIRDRYEGRPDAIGSFRSDLAARGLDYLDQLEASVKSCTCGASHEAFRIPTERTDAAPYEAMSQNRIDRLLFGEV